MPEAAGTQGTAAPTSTSPSGTSSGLTNGANGGTAAGGWLQSLPPEYRADKSLARYKDLPDFVKGHKELEKQFSSGARIPGPDATDEERSAFYNKLGRPESPDKYEIKFAEGTPVDDALLGAFRGVAHKLGLSQTQAQALGEWWAGQAGAQAETQGNEIKGDLETWDKELTTEWGWKKDQNIALAARAFNRAVDGTDLAQPLAEFLDNTGLGNHPLMIKFFHALALKNGEDKLVTAETGPTADDRQTAKEQINEIRGNKEHPYNLPKHPSHKDAIRHMQALYDMVYAKEE